jgi:hypothetical protein
MVFRLLAIEHSISSDDAASGLDSLNDGAECSGGDSGKQQRVWVGAAPAAAQLYLVQQPLAPGEQLLPALAALNGLGSF